MLSSSIAKAALATLLLSQPCNASPRKRGQEKSSKPKKYPIYKMDKLDELPKEEDILDVQTTKATAAYDKELRIDSSDLYELSTTYEGGWVQDGIMFDVAVSNSTEGIAVLGLDILTPVAFQTLCVEIYSHDGSYEGSDIDPSAWEYLGSVSVLGLGKDTPTTIPLGSFDPVSIGPDSTRAFYVTTQDESMRYTAYPSGEHVSGSIFSSSSEGGVNVDVLVGVAKNYPFAQSWPDRMFNGAIRYAIGDNLDLDSMLTDEQKVTANVAKKGKFTCDEEPAVTTSSPTTASPVLSVTTGSPVSSPTITSSPVTVSTSTVAPVAAVTTPQPSEALTAVPTDAPTTLAFTMKKLATTLHGGLKQAGVMFDIRVPTVDEGGPAEGVTILTFEVSTFLTDDICVEVYSKEGTHVGYENDVAQGSDGSWSSSTWFALGAATATGMGEALPTHLPVGAFDQTYIAPGETRAFYVTMNIPEMRYTEPRYNEETGDIFVESSMNHLQIMVGTANAYPFGDSWADRIFNGAVIFALGDVEDGTYSETSANDRSRSCPASATTSTSPTTVESPVVSTSGTQSTTSGGEPTTVAGTESTSTDPNDGGDEQGEDQQDDDDETLSASTSRLDDNCPSASPADASASKEVIIEYKYSMITSSGESVTEMENTMHSELIASKCSARESRRLQESNMYYGFNSNPPDEVVVGEECTGVTLSAVEVCNVVKGGFTAYVPESVDDSAVQSDLEPFANGVLTENGAVVESDADSARGDVGAATAEEQTQDGIDAENNASLSPVAIIVLAAVAGCVALALVLIFVKGRNRSKRGGGNQEMFHEFNEDQTELGHDMGNVSRSADAPLFPRLDEESTIGGNAPVILNEHDEMSLISNDLSKARFVFPPPTTPGSDAGSRSSKGSVKFVRAGESFTSRSHQPEDTVDL
jgi:hypothetical protein